MLQLRMAVQAGFNIPATLVTTDANAVSRFRTNIGPIVSKPMNGHSQEMVKARLIASDESINSELLGACPSLFQEAILGGEDFRVTVIDNEVFPARIRRPEGFDDIDWRLDLNVEFENFTLPEEVTTSIRRYMSSMGLRY